MRVVIAHPDGREYSVTEAGFRGLYAEQGFKVVRNEDGTPYEGASGSSDEDKAAQRRERSRISSARRREKLRAERAANGGDEG